MIARGKAARSGCLRTQDLASTPYLGLIEIEKRGLPPMTKGHNPKIFVYDFDFQKHDGASLCRMRFYEGYPIYVTWNFTIAE